MTAIGDGKEGVVRAGQGRRQGIAQAVLYVLVCGPSGCADHADPSPRGYATSVTAMPGAATPGARAESERDGWIDPDLACHGTCREVCECQKTACEVDGRDPNCAGGERLCLEACGRSTCDHEDPSCTFPPVPPPQQIGSPADPPADGPGGPGPDPSPLD